MALNVGQLVAALEEMAPLKLQAEWDNSGLQVGSKKWGAEKVLLTLDVTPEVMDYAIAGGYELIVAHHPLIFKKLSRVDMATPGGQIIARAIEHKITIYALHTNLDVVQGGVSDVLAKKIGLEKVDVLEKQKGDYYKLVVFVPQDHVDKLRQALGDAGAGWIGNYSHCTFGTPGTGSFLPREGANPYLGSEGKLEEVEEYRLETLVEGHRLPSVLQAMERAHPYEEVAYDLLPMANTANYGLGRVGHLPTKMNLEHFAALVKEKTGFPVRVAGEKTKLVKKIALCGGSGGNFVHLAWRKGADVLLTGDVSHHQALDALQLGLAVVDAGHYATEYPVIDAVQSFLTDKFADQLKVTKYPESTEPFMVYI